jgi:hypothetical protein
MSEGFAAAVRERSEQRVGNDLIAESGKIAVIGGSDVSQGWSGRHCCRGRGEPSLVPKTVFFMVTVPWLCRTSAWLRLKVAVLSTAVTLTRLTVSSLLLLIAAWPASSR